MTWTLDFAEVTGLETSSPPIEYRHSNSPVFSTMKMPGLGKTGNVVVLRKGIFANDASFWNWVSQIKMNVISRRTVVVKLLDEAGAPTMVWTLHNAWPTKISGTDLKSEGNEVAVESLELAFETMVVTAP
jgi:phage tail-like protein